MVRQPPHVVIRRYLQDAIAAEEARRLGDGARLAALDRFNIHRFVRDWNEAFTLVTGGIPFASWAAA